MAWCQHRFLEAGAAEPVLIQEEDSEIHQVPASATDISRKTSQPNVSVAPQTVPLPAGPSKDGPEDGHRVLGEGDREALGLRQASWQNGVAQASYALLSPTRHYSSLL